MKKCSACDFFIEANRQQWLISAITGLELPPLLTESQAIAQWRTRYTGAVK
ncbi:MAG: hypothetical protein LPD71_13350 [Shewanella sp.]|nr:hypothetical protein [Shewanella sp.]MCF1429930.1 hypothetical protein [Shewanella sp.]MCF1439682.1 hypothetical protein [Shewanella sp.]MCF1456755.1 hypothetical protein [Shewanella sp.]